MSDTSNHEALGGSTKKKAAMGNSQPGSTSHPEETLGGKAKKKVAPAHVGAYKSTSHPEETLGGMPKRKVTNGGAGSSDGY